MERAHVVIQVARVTQAAESGSGETTTVNVLIPLDELQSYSSATGHEAFISAVIQDAGEAIRNRLGANNALIRAKTAERHAEKQAAMRRKPDSSGIASTVTHDT